MKKIFISNNETTLLFIVFILDQIPMNTFAEPIYNQELSNLDNKIQVKDYTKQKTVIKIYSSVLDIPDYIYYEEYDANIGMMMGGTLHYKSHEYKNNKYHATFSGTLYAGLFRINLDL